MMWVHDIEVEHKALTTTGGRVWPAARRLCEFLESMACTIGLNRPGINILELGAGLGWLGMTVARNLHSSAQVCLTEQVNGGGLEWLQHNVHLNAAKLSASNLVTLPCDWNDYADDTTDASCSGGSDKPALAATQWDVIIASDLIYNSGGSHMLPRVLRALCTPGNTDVYYCHTKHRFDLQDMEFLEQLEVNGLTCTEVREPGVPTPPPSPPPLQELFPDQRIAVFHITCGSGWWRQLIRK